MSSRMQVLLRRLAAVIVTAWLIGWPLGLLLGLPAWTDFHPDKPGRTTTAAIWYLLGPIALAAGALVLLIFGTGLACFYSWAFEPREKISERRAEQLRAELATLDEVIDGR